MSIEDTTMHTYRITSRLLSTADGYPLGYNFFVVCLAEKVEQSRVLLHTSWDKESPLDKGLNLSITKKLYYTHIEIIHKYLETLDSDVLEKLNADIPLINLDFSVAHTRENRILCFAYPSLGLEIEPASTVAPSENQNEDPGKRNSNAKTM